MRRTALRAVVSHLLSLVVFDCETLRVGASLVLHGHQPAVWTLDDLIWLLFLLTEHYTLLILAAIGAAPH